MLEVSTEYKIKNAQRFEACWAFGILQMSRPLCSGAHLGHVIPTLSIKWPKPLDLFSQYPVGELNPCCKNENLES